MLANHTMVIISQCICVSKKSRRIPYNYTVMYVNHISIKLENIKNWNHKKIKIKNGQETWIDISPVNILFGIGGEHEVRYYQTVLKWNVLGFTGWLQQNNWVCHKIPRNRWSQEDLKYPDTGNTLHCSDLFFLSDCIQFQYYNMEATFLQELDVPTSSP